jgi:lactoylglutathione lyase
MKSLLFFIYLVAMNSIVNAQHQRPVINHIALNVKDLQKSVTFYQNIIGLDTIPEPFHDGNHTWFSIGRAQLHLIGRAKEISSQSKQSHILLQRNFC